MKRASCLLVIGIAGLFAAPAAAEIVRLGPELGPLAVDGEFQCTAANCTVAQRSPSYVSPVTGQVVEWQVKGATGNFVLEVIDGNTGKATSTFGKAEGGKSSFTSSVPIEAGDRFGIEILDSSGILGFAKAEGASIDSWQPALAVGNTKAPSKFEPSGGAKLLANVRIQPAPTIASVSPTVGPSQSPTPVTITGTDFIGVTEVAFGDFDANYQVVSPTEIVAEAISPFTTGSTVDVKVVAEGGAAIAPGAFTFQPITAGPVPTPGENFPAPIPPIMIPPLTIPEEVECLVPNLKGKTLAGAKPLLTAAHCRLGKITHSKRGKGKKARARRGKVVSELPPAGAHAPADTAVALKLG